jgi:hypothetical protein
MTKVTFHALGSGKCALTGKDESDGLTLAFDNEAPVFLGKKAFFQLLAMRLSQAKQAAPKPDTKPDVPRAVAALPQNGPATASK